MDCSCASRACEQIDAGSKIEQKLEVRRRTWRSLPRDVRTTNCSLVSCTDSNATSLTLGSQTWPSTARRTQRRSGACSLVCDEPLAATDNDACSCRVCVQWSKESYECTLRRQRKDEEQRAREEQMVRLHHEAIAESAKHAMHLEADMRASESGELQSLAKEISAQPTEPKPEETNEMVWHPYVRRCRGVRRCCWSGPCLTDGSCVCVSTASSKSSCRSRASTWSGRAGATTSATSPIHRLRLQCQCESHCVLLSVLLLVLRSPLAAATERSGCHCDTLMAALTTSCSPTHTSAPYKATDAREHERAGQNFAIPTLGGASAAAHGRP